jgi:hypothetical protein
VQVTVGAVKPQVHLPPDNCCERVEGLTDRAVNTVGALPITSSNPPALTKVRLEGRVAVTVTLPAVVATLPLLTTVTVYVPFVPTVNVLGECVEEIAMFGPDAVAEIVVGSVPVSFDVLVSPPPDTATIFVTLAGALAETVTVNVIAG